MNILANRAVRWTAFEWVLTNGELFSTAPSDIGLCVFQRAQTERWHWCAWHFDTDGYLHDTSNMKHDGYASAEDARNAAERWGRRPVYGSVTTRRKTS